MERSSAGMTDPFPLKNSSLLHKFVKSRSNEMHSDHASFLPAYMQNAEMKRKAIHDQKISCRFCLQLIGARRSLGGSNAAMASDPLFMKKVLQTWQAIAVAGKASRITAD